MVSLGLLRYFKSNSLPLSRGFSYGTGTKYGQSIENRGRSAASFSRWKKEITDRPLSSPVCPRFCLSDRRKKKTADGFRAAPAVVIRDDGVSYGFDMIIGVSHGNSEACSLQHSQVVVRVTYGNTF